VELLVKLRDRFEPSTEDAAPQQPRQDDPMDLFSLAGMQIG
jgi:hypothetical protein